MELQAFGDSYTVVAPDLRGYNLSDKPARIQDYRMDLLVDDVLGLIRHFGRDRAAVVGHDWGAAIAWAVALKHPERVWKLAALQVPPTSAWRDNMTLQQALRSWYMLFFQIPRVPEWLISKDNFASLERTFKSTVARPESFTDSDIEIYKKAFREQGALSGAINYYRANFFSLFFSNKNKEAAPGSKKVRVPTLFIYGERDFAIVPATVRNVQKYVDAPFREVRIASSGHWVQNEAIAEVNAALKTFLDVS